MWWACPGTGPRCARAAHLLRAVSQQTRMPALTRSLPRHFTSTHVSRLPLVLHSACHVITRPGSWARLRHQILTRGLRRACESASPDTRPPHFPLYIFSCATCLAGVWGFDGLESWCPWVLRELAPCSKCHVLSAMFQLPCSKFHIASAMF